MKKIITAIIAFMLTAGAVFSFASCKNENQPSTGWEVQNFVEEGDESSDTQGETFTHKLGFTVGDGKKKISEIWVNIPKIYGDEADFTVDVFSTSSGDSLIKRTASPTYPTFERKVTKDEVKEAKELNYWIKLDFNDYWKDKDTTYSKNVMVGVKGEFEFNEIVFLDENGKLLSVNLSKVNYWYQPEDSSTTRNVTKTSDIPDVEKNPFKLVDEQSKFALRDKK